jgi:hypothetical protein
MTDEDVIQKTSKLFELNYYHKIMNHRRANRKPGFHIVFRGKRAAALMSRLYPLMGERRKRQIEVSICEKPDLQYSSTEENWFYWLIGLLEGEGSFQKSIPSRQNQPRIQLNVTDQDVVAHAALLIGTNCKGPYERHGADAGRKPRYFADLRGKRAIDLMKQLQPHMSIRRQAQIDAVLASYHPVGQVRGERHPQSKLNADKVHEIKRRLVDGEKLIALADEFKVDKGLIWQIKAGRIWQHVE